MTKKILLYTDSGKAVDLQMKVTEIKDQCNELINIYQAFSGDLVQTIEHWHGLVTDPVKYFDDYLIRTVKLNIGGGRAINTEQLALLAGYDRANFAAAVTGMPVDINCEPCKKIIRRRTKPAVSRSSYNLYADLLTFANGIFNVDRPALENYCQRFSYYAEGPAQLQRLKHWNDLKDSLQAHLNAGHIGPAGAQIIADFCKLRFVNLKFHLDDLTVRNDVMKQQTNIPA